MKLKKQWYNMTESWCSCDNDNLRNNEGDHFIKVAIREGCTVIINITLLWVNRDAIDSHNMIMLSQYSFAFELHAGKTVT